MTTIQIHTQKKQNNISPLLYGIFFEDINYGGDGGLYAELVANRSFEYCGRMPSIPGGSDDGTMEERTNRPEEETMEERTNCPEEETMGERARDQNRTELHKMCWEAIPSTDFVIASENPLNKIHNHYARIGGAAGCGITNTGFGGEGFAVKAGMILRFSCYVRVTKTTRIAVLISDRQENVYASRELMCLAGGWRRVEAELVANGASPKAFLSLALPAGGNADLEFISLFPNDTFCGRENGMRKDIAELIRDMKPKFMRFPGGCIVEGRSIENMYRWKDTIGPVLERRTNWNRWQMEEYQQPGCESSDYYQSYGIGFYEYFLFCEDIGAKPLPVVNCGMTCQWHEGLLVETDNLAPFVQDVLDLIEFANGDADSGWGKRRAQMGHREPFHLEYIGIGNEQWGEEYFARYEIFQRAVAEKYPAVRLVTSAGWKNCGWEFDLAYGWLERNKDKAYAVDEHFYKEPEWFLENDCRYDGYDRSLPKVLIGEYAAHTAAEITDRRNNWYAALSEAAFLTGVERNADHVVMTCYAPLLAKSGHQQWQPNLIWFDNTDAYGTPSYYVQKLFAEYVGDTAVESLCVDRDIRISASVDGDRLFIKLVNVSDQDKEVSLAIDRDLKLVKAALLHADLAAENTLAQPQCVYPREISAAQFAGHWALKGYSVMCLEYSADR